MDTVQLILPEDYINDWQNRAACRGKNPEIQYLHTYYDPDTEAKERARRIEEAKELCSGCDVQLQCLGSALDYEAREAESAANGQDVGTLQHRHGIWGGKTEEEREDLANLNPDEFFRRLLAVSALKRV